MFYCFSLIDVSFCLMFVLFYCCYLLNIWSKVELSICMNCVFIGVGKWRFIKIINDKACEGSFWLCFFLQDGTLWMGEAAAKHQEMWVCVHLVLPFVLSDPIIVDSFKPVNSHWLYMQMYTYISGTNECSVFYTKKDMCSWITSELTVGTNS